MTYESVERTPEHQDRHDRVMKELEEAFGPGQTYREESGGRASHRSAASESSIGAKHSTPPRSGGLSLEQDSNHCGEHKEVCRYEFHPGKCNSWLCCQCRVSKGLALQERLIEILNSFTHIETLTLTMDPTLFASPQAALEYCKKKRVIGELVRSLNKRGLLHSDRYFCVVEWQQETEMPHFHVIVDATGLLKHENFTYIKERWHRFRPKEAGPIQGARPGFGSIRLSVPKKKRLKPKQAAKYACKYLIKEPKYGYPDWVYELSSKEFHLYRTSHGFFKSIESEGINDESIAEEVIEEQKEVSKPDPSETSKPCKTHRERLLTCRQSVKVFCKTMTCNGDGEIIKERYQYMETIPISFHDVIMEIGMTSVEGIPSSEYSNIRPKLKILAPANSPQRELVCCPNAHLHPDRIAERDAWIEYEKEKEWRNKL